jgi:hypothetical protein
MDWNSLLKAAPKYGFLGGVVGITALIVGTTSAIIYSFTGKFSDWKPAKGSPLEGLNSVVGLVCAFWIIGAWYFAAPGYEVLYLKIAAALVSISVIAFLAYVGLRVICGRFTKPTVDEHNKPGKPEVIWGGLWLTPKAKESVKKGGTVQAFYAGTMYEKDKVWPPKSQAFSAILTGVILLLFVSSGASGLSTLATTAQVVLTKKPARDILSSSDVPGLLPPKASPAPISH